MKISLSHGSVLALALSISGMASANTSLKATMKAMGTQFGALAQFVNVPANTSATVDQVSDAIVLARTVEFHLALVNERADGEMIPDKIAALSGAERDAKIVEARDLLTQTHDETAHLEQLLIDARGAAVPRDYTQAKMSIQKLGGLIGKAHMIFK